ncbi:MAG: TonB-dependent receptor [Saprospiraceae bacterium]
MILRNPSLWRDSFFMACSFYIFFFTSTLSGQGVIGTVKDAQSNHPLPGAIISILKADSTIANFSTDSLGRFSYVSGDAGRITISVKALGYIDQLLTDMLLDGYSTHQIDISMDVSLHELGAVVVSSGSSFINSYAYHITKNDLLTVAGNFDDPVRIAHSQPGILMVNDQANHFSTRGEQPALNTWYLEGLEIVNPNHTNNAGTFADLPVESGGGVNMFSAQVLGSTDVYTGLNPLRVGRSAGAVIDMHLHETAKPEFRAKAGLLGFEFGGGAKVGSQGILDFNLRYSFTGLLANLGVDFGGEKIGFYDGVVSYRVQGPNYKLKLFGWAGRSTNEFNRLGADEEKTRYKDFFDIDYANDIAGAGVRYESVLSRKATFRFGSAYSLLKSTYSRHGQFGPAPVDFNLDELTRLFSSNAEILFQHSSRFNTSAGVDYVNKNLNYSPYSLLRITDESFLRPYINSNIELSHTFGIEAGIEYHALVFYEFPTSNSVFGYRAVINWKLTDHTLLYGGVRHAGGQVVRGFSHIEEYDPALVIDKYELGFNLFGINNSHESSILLKTYFQEIKNMTVFLQSNGYVHLADFSEPIEGDFVSRNALGTSQSYGIEGQWDYQNGKGYRIALNQTLFRSFRKIDDEAFSAGRFDNQYAFHLSLSKEIIKSRKGKNRIWNFSLRGLFQGGFREPTIDELQSGVAEATVYADPYNFGLKLPPYKRIDAGIYRTIANTKIKWRYALDIQNLLGLSNVAFHYYDPFLHGVQTQAQLGIIPVFSVQASW